MARFEDYVNEDTLNALRKQKPENELENSKDDSSLPNILTGEGRLKAALNAALAAKGIIKDVISDKESPPEFSPKGGGIHPSMDLLDVIGPGELKMGAKALTKMGTKALEGSSGALKVTQEATQKLAEKYPQIFGKLAEERGSFSLGEAISPKVKEEMQSVANRAGAKKLAEEVRSGSRSLSADEINAINEDPELLAEFTKEMSTPKQDFTLVGGPRNVPGKDFRMVGEGKFTPYNPAGTTELAVAEKKAIEEASQLPETLGERSIIKKPVVLNEPIEASFRELATVPEIKGLSKADKIKLGLVGLGSGITAYNLTPKQQNELLQEGGYGSSQMPPKDSLSQILADTGAGKEQKPEEPSMPESQGGPSGIMQPDVGYHQSLLDAFKKAQEEDKQRKAMAMLAMGASDMLRGGLSASYKVALPEASNKFWEEQLKSGDATKAFLAEQEMQKEDPNSPISKRMREIMTPMLKKLNINLPENVSYSEMKENFPQYTKMYDTQIMQEQKTEEKELARQEKRKQESKLSDKQNDTITKLDNALSVIDDIQTSKEKFDTGPISNIQSKIAGTVGIDTPEKTAFRAKVGDQLAQYLHDLSGAAITPQEYSRLVQNLPTAADNDKTFNAKLQALKERVEMQKRNSLSNFEKQGKDVSEYKQPMSSKPSEESLKSPKIKNLNELKPGDIFFDEKTKKMYKVSPDGANADEV